MKQTLYTLMACCLLVWMAACQSEEEFTGSDTGYLRLQLGINTYAETRAYDPEQIGVQILSEDGSVVKETSDWQEWAGQQIALPAGNYTLKASSAGFDGKSGFDKPYYAGSADITVEKGKEVNQKITCTLANVKVTVNFDATTNYYVTANLPFQPAKWWQLNLNAVYMRRGQRVEQHGAQQHFNWAFVNASTSFNLPAKFYIDLSYAYQSRIDLGNIWVMPNHFLQAGVKKRFGERFVLSFSARNLLDQGQKVGAAGDGFVRTVNIRQAWGKIQYRFGVTWNFKSGKAFNRKSVEAGSAEEKKRL